MSLIKEISEKDIEYELDADGVFNFLRKSNKFWKENPGFWVFRGHFDANWKLVPNAWRDSCKKIKPFLRLVKGWDLPEINPKPSDKQVEFYQLINAEAKAVDLFRDTANKTGLEIPKDMIFSTTNKNGKLNTSYIDFPITGLHVRAQHYGMPTRLIDWTSDPINALFFAIHPEERVISNSDNFCIWAFNTDKLNHYNGFYGNEYFYLDFHTEYNYLNTYQRSQGGFQCSIEGSAVPKFYTEHGTFPGIEDVVDSINKVGVAPSLLKIIISKEHINEIKEIMYNQLLFTRANLMPTLDNVAKSVIEITDFLYR